MSKFILDQAKEVRGADYEDDEEPLAAVTRRRRQKFIESPEEIDSEEEIRPRRPRRPKKSKSKRSESNGEMKLNQEEELQQELRELRDDAESEEEVNSDAFVEHSGITDEESDSQEDNASRTSSASIASQNAHMESFLAGIPLDEDRGLMDLVFVDAPVEANEIATTNSTSGRYHVETTLPYDANAWEKARKDAITHKRLATLYEKNEFLFTVFTQQKDFERHLKAQKEEHNFDTIKHVGYIVPVTDVICLTLDRILIAACDFSSLDKLDLHFVAASQSGWDQWMDGTFQFTDTITKFLKEKWASKAIKITAGEVRVSGVSEGFFRTEFFAGLALATEKNVEATSLDYHYLVSDLKKRVITKVDGVLPPLGIMVEE